MRKMLILCQFILIVFTGCSCIDTSNSDDVARKQCDEIIRCLNERDKSGLENMFCDNVISSTDSNIEQQIDDVFVLLDGNTVVSYDVISGNESKSVDSGEITRLEIYPIIRPAKLSNDEEYEIFFYSYVFCENQRNIGISEITVCDSNKKEYTIGDASIVHPNI